MKQSNGTSIHRKFFARGWSVLAAALVLAACGSSAPGRDDPAYDGVLRYCERFAAAAPGRLIDSRGAYYVAGSARVVRPRLGDVVTRLSNTFQPPDSRFVAAWRCRFSISMNGQSCAGKVALTLAEHTEFAEHTSWPRLAIIDGNRILSAGGTTIGYATPKYFETSCPDGVG